MLPVALGLWKGPSFCSAPGPKLNLKFDLFGLIILILLAIFLPKHAKLQLKLLKATEGRNTAGRILACCFSPWLRSYYSPDQCLT